MSPHWQPFVDSLRHSCTNKASITTKVDLTLCTHFHINIIIRDAHVHQFDCA